MIDNKQKCRLVDGEFQLIVQLLLFLVCLGTLIIKRHTENPQRLFKIWALDGLKQGIGALFGHFSNIALSIIINKSIINGNGDECLFYCLSFILDCTIGTMINLLLLYSFETLLKTKFGEYGNDLLNPSLFIWFYQLIVWLIIIIISKLFILIFFFQTSNELDYILGYLFEPIQRYPNIELILVMIVIPFILNVIQFWIQDNFLKGKKNLKFQQILSIDLDEELISSSRQSSIEMNNLNIDNNNNSNDTYIDNLHCNSSGNSNNSSNGSNSPKRLHYFTKTLLSKFSIINKLPKKSSSGDLQQME